jgi:sulfur carrier protein
MQLVINGENRQIESVTSVLQLLQHLGYEPNAIAVALDGRFIPRHQYETFSIQENQALDIVAPMQGG